MTSLAWSGTHQGKGLLQQTKFNTRQGTDMQSDAGNTFSMVLQRNRLHLREHALADGQFMHQGVPAKASISSYSSQAERAASTDIF